MRRIYCSSLRRLTTITGLFALAASMAAPTAARAAEAQATLKSVDEAINRWKDQFFAYEMIDTQSGRGERTLGLEVYMKGEQRVTAFTAPADVKGTRVLIKSDTQMYVYLPAYKKVRRIASHVTAQGFMGTAYSQDDLAISTYADKYEAKVVEDKGETVKLELVVKKGKEVAYPKVHMTVELKRRLPTELTYFDDKGTKLKTESRTDYECKGEICVPFTMKMVDHTSPGHETRLVTKEWKLDTGLKDRIFTRRYLQRGR